jgi:hypothetical protein
MCPSQEEIRDMLRENHVLFEVADVAKNLPNASQGNSFTSSSTTAIVPVASAEKSALETNQPDLLELRQDGECVNLLPTQIGNTKQRSTAIWVEGAWSVHCMLDVLRQCHGSFRASSLPCNSAMLQSIRLKL